MKSIFLPPKMIRSFAAVRKRIKAAVAKQPTSVTLEEARAQVNKKSQVNKK